MKPLYTWFETYAPGFNADGCRLTVRGARGVQPMLSVKPIYPLSPDISTIAEYTAIFKSGEQEPLSYPNFPDLKSLTPTESLNILTAENNKALGLSENDGGSAARYLYDYRKELLFSLPFAPDTEKSVRLT